MIWDAKIMPLRITPIWDLFPEWLKCVLISPFICLLGISNLASDLPFPGPFAIFLTSVIGNVVLPITQNKNCGFIIKLLFPPNLLPSISKLYNLFPISPVRLWPLVSTFIAITLDDANIVSQLDCCNSFLPGLLSFTPGFLLGIF